MSNKRKTVVILQSNYIPWKGYFDLIQRADEFILFDDMQYTRRDWRNRNRIKTSQGLHWLTIPVQVKGKYYQPIREVVVSDPEWNSRHWQTIANYYARAPHFDWCASWLEPCYRNCDEQYLSRINHRFLTTICHRLGIDTRISWSMDYEIPEGKTERLVSICQQAGATDYLSGPAARDYIDESQFDDAGIALHWMNYQGYPTYPQLFGPFEHHVSIVDLLMNMGPDSAAYIQPESGRQANQTTQLDYREDNQTLANSTEDVFVRNT